mgnify:CR=1 FL=1
MYEIDGLIFNTQEEYREYLKTSEDYCKTYERWTKEEDIELQKLSKKKSVEELCHHFKRVKGSITSRLLKLPIIKENLTNINVITLKDDIDQKVVNEVSTVRDNISSKVIKDVLNFKKKNKSLLEDQIHENGYVYILLCKENKLYVGHTSNPSKERIWRHLSKKQTLWTKRFPTIDVIMVLDNFSKVVEQLLTEYLMIKYGHNTVRGGSYIQKQDYLKPIDRLENPTFKL